MALIGFQDIVRQHGIIQLTFELQPVIGQDGQVVFNVLGYLPDIFVFKQGAELVQYGLRLFKPG
ncbi:hypothetical protein FQZ97_1079200 [compost metagenome]